MAFKEIPSTSNRSRMKNTGKYGVLNVEDPEIITNEEDQGDNNHWMTDELKQDIVRKSLNYIPEIIALARDIVEIGKIQVQTEATIKILKQKGELLQDQAKAFVTVESEKRKSFVEESKMVRENLEALHKIILSENVSDDVKKEIIRTTDNAIRLQLEQRKEAKGNE